MIEINGIRGLDAQLKAETMSAMWVPAVNALETHGRWAFGEFRDVYEIEKAFRELVEKAIAVSRPGSERSQSVISAGGSR